MNDFTIEIPSSTRHKNDTWNVQFRPLPRGRYGECIFADKTIIINSRLRRTDTIASTLVHELIHAIAWPLSESCVVCMEKVIMDGITQVLITAPERKPRR
jgi:hypothetical protein